MVTEHEVDVLIVSILFEQTGVVQYHEWHQDSKKKEAVKRRDREIQKLKRLILNEKEYTELLIAQVRKETIEECEQVAQDWLDKHFFYDKRCESVREVLDGIKALRNE